MQSRSFLDNLEQPNVSANYTPQLSSARPQPPPVWVSLLISSLSSLLVLSTVITCHMSGCVLCSLLITVSIVVIDNANCKHNTARQLGRVWQPDNIGCVSYRRQDHCLLPAECQVPCPGLLTCSADDGAASGRMLCSSAANRLIGEVVQSRRRPLRGPSPGWKRLLPLSHLRHY